jgi:hypothetical protein
MIAIVENPVGPIVLGIDPENPYKDLNSPKGSGNTRCVYFGDIPAILTDEEIEMAVELDRKSSSMRVLTFIDGMFAVLNFAATGYPLSVIACIVSYMGYRGTVTYNRGMVIFYFWYQILLTMGRIAITVVAINDHTPVKFLILLPIMTAVQAYIAWYVYKFYSLLPKTSLY